jgi:uncharacterized protein
LNHVRKRYRFYPTAANEAKHGINFVSVQALREDQGPGEVPARTEDEPRFLVIGRIGETHWSVVITYREE